MDGKASFSIFDMPYDLSFYAKTSTDVDNLLCRVWVEIDFHSVSHVEHLVHLFPFGLAFFFDDLEEKIAKKMGR